MISIEDLSESSSSILWNFSLVTVDLNSPDQYLLIHSKDVHKNSVFIELSDLPPPPREPALGENLAIETGYRVRG